MIKRVKIPFDPFLSFFIIFYHFLLFSIIVLHPVLSYQSFLNFLSNTRTDKCNRITDLHIFLHIDCRAHHRTMYRDQPRNQFRNIFFHISNNRRTWLRNASCKIMFRNIFQISPRRNICAKRNTANMIDTFLFQISQNFLIFLWIVCQKSRCQNYRNLLSLR